MNHELTGVSAQLANHGLYGFVKQVKLANPVDTIASTLCAPHFDLPP